MSQGWIDAKAFSFNSLLLMDAWIVRYLSFKTDPAFNGQFAVALAANPIVCWYFGARCPDRKDYFEALAATAPANLPSEEVQKSERYVLDALDTFIVYLYPALMDELPYIKTWDPERLLSMADFTNKTVLDIGSGTGRLAIAVAPLAKWVYACEPVARLREYLRDKLDRLGITNVYVVDGMVDRLPFPDASFDIVMSGHVIGADYEAECEEMERVTIEGGVIISCSGEEAKKQSDGPDQELLARGFEAIHYTSVLGGDVFQYWKQKAAAV